MIAVTDEPKAREATDLCDRFLSDICHQTLVEQAKVVDFVLDLRELLKRHSQ